MTVTLAAALPLLASRGNVASVAGMGGDLGMTTYNAAKGAVLSLMRFPRRGPRSAMRSLQRDGASLRLADATTGIPDDDVAEFVRRIPEGHAAEPADLPPGGRG